MSSKRLFSFLSAFAIVLLLMVMVIKYALHEDAYWRKSSGLGLNAKMQTGLTQMYWQWQADGRASEIEYWPDNEQQGFFIQMNDEGRPVVDKSVDGCLQFLYWFIDEKSLNKNVNVTTTFIQTQSNSQAGENNLPNKNIRSETETAKCKFQYSENIYTYDLNSGQLTFTD